jgi:hypothetical protein
MKSHFALPRGVAAACAVAGASSMLNGNCSAQKLIAADYATNSTYAAGWSAGQNGGFGWGPWSTNGSVGISHAMDRTSPYDPFGVAWTLYDPAGTPNNPALGGPPDQCVTPPTGIDASKAGRAFPNGALQPGQTFSTVIANPNTRRFYRGYTIVLSTGSDNFPYSHLGDEIDVGTFEYFSYGQWYTSATYPTGRISLFDSNTTTNGMQVDITMTGTNTYHLAITPLGNPALAYSEDADTVTNPVQWVTYQMYNTDSHFYPTLVSCPPNGPDRTDFYIKSMTVSQLTLDIQRAGTNVLLSWPALFTNFTLVSSTNLSAPGWSPVSTNQSGVVNGQNVVTNSISGTTGQFYRLQFQQQLGITP